ncbi:hypothetical protein GCM10009556_089910 [Acrocarpospora pleiomorpha]|nr:ATP-binding protein [Acrocarpospora pleiomorpha]
MVGRAAELATVRSMVDGVRRGRGGVLLVSGEAGIGKSRLLREAAERARDAGLAVATGRAVEGGGTYRPLSEALGALRSATPHLLVPAGDELRWRHTLTREAVLAGVTPPERAAVARRAADVLLSRGEPARCTARRITWRGRRLPARCDPRW